MCCRDLGQDRREPPAGMVMGANAQGVNVQGPMTTVPGEAVAAAAGPPFSKPAAPADRAITPTAARSLRPLRSSLGAAAREFKNRPGTCTYSNTG